jgi:AcrR family transcriptional regulator
MAVATRPYHHGNLRSALLDGAERALARDGVQALSLRELAREIGVSHAAPRRHFAGKQALLDALAEDGFERLGRAMATAIVDAGPAFGDRLRAVAYTYVRFATEHAALLQLMYAGKRRPGAADSLREAADRAFEGPLAMMAEAQAAGEAVGTDPLRAGVTAWAAFHGLAGMLNSGLIDEIPLEELVDTAVEHLLGGLRPR